MDSIFWLALVSTIIVTLFLPFTLALILRRNLQVPLAMFFWAALFYLINLILQIPLLSLLRPLGVINGTVLYAIVTSIIYGLCEEILRYLSYRSGKSMRRNRDHNGALIAGLGHGGTEALILGFLPTINYFYAAVAPSAFTASAKAMGLSTTASQFLVGASAALFLIALGRIFAIIGHLAFSTLSVMAYRCSWLFLPLVSITHIVFDASTFIVGVLTKNEFWTMLLFGLWAAASLVFLIAVRRNGIIKPLPALTGNGSQIANQQPPKDSVVPPGQ